ncbi:MAG: aldehyde dehydrogenase [Rhodospirillales bacterium]|nr:aldehyde dehydrogenase [Rhodospirillales bacterium]USO07538.1 MAG: aldehyde dehydrogenase [Rhodospirillales bacterium]
MANPVQKIRNEATLVSTNPACDYAVLGEVAVSTPADIAAAVQKARAAQPGWQALGVDGRLKAISRLVAAIENHAEDLIQATAQEMGMPVKGARGTHDWSMWHMRWYLDNAAACLAPETTFENETERHQTVFEPYGVAAVIVPWNFPLSNFVMGAFQPLLAGNTVVLKGSEEVPLFYRRLNEVIRESGMPEGVINMVYGAGEVGEALVRADIDLICFTGSSAVGKKLYRIAAEKFIPAHLELGGSDAGIVCEDADVQANAEAIYGAKFINNGQICCGLKRLLVHESRLDETVAALKAIIESQKLGDPLDENTDLGPLVAERQQKRLIEQVADARAKGAVCVTGGAVPENLKGAYYAPTLLTNVTPDMRVWCEEVFGPVLPIRTFKTDNDAIAMANDTPYGLSGYVFTKDEGRAQKIAAALRAGSISHNGVDYSGPYNAFGGYKDSGLKRTGGKQGFRDACQVKTLSIRKTS